MKVFLGSSCVHVMMQLSWIFLSNSMYTLEPTRMRCVMRMFAAVVVSSAYQCLTDPSKRRTYDQYGVEDLRSAGRSNGHAGCVLSDESRGVLFGKMICLGRV